MAIVKTAQIALLLLSLAALNSQAETKAGQLYQPCAGCNLATAEGVPGMFPPLTERLGPLAGKSKGRAYLALVLEAGLIGDLKIDGNDYRHNMMPGQSLSAADSAAVLNYVLKHFNAKTLPKNWQPYTAAEIESIKQRYPNVDARKVYKMRRGLL